MVKVGRKKGRKSIHTVTFRLTDEEKQYLDLICNHKKKTKSNILKEGMYYSIKNSLLFSKFTHDELVACEMALLYKK